jgi:hypothetical protein
MQDLRVDASLLIDLYVDEGAPFVINAIDGKERLTPAEAS